MKLKVRKMDNGLWDIEVRRTRPSERWTQARYGVRDEDYAKVVEELVSMVKPRPASADGE